MLMKEMALKLEDLSLAEFVKAVKEEDVSFLQAREGICWRKKKAKRTFVRNWCLGLGKHTGLGWEMIRSSMCLWTNLTSNTVFLMNCKAEAAS